MPNLTYRVHALASVYTLKYIRDNIPNLHNMMMTLCQGPSGLSLDKFHWNWSKA